MPEFNLDAVAFPKLDDEQMAKLGRYAAVSPKKLRAGEALFQWGDRDSSFFVIKSGEVKLIDDPGDKPKAEWRQPSQLFSQTSRFRRG